jgi:hypothetical protein
MAYGDAIKSKVSFGDQYAFDLGPDPDEDFQGENT